MWLIVVYGHGLILHVTKANNSHDQRKNVWLNVVYGHALIYYMSLKVWNSHENKATCEGK